MHAADVVETLPTARPDDTILSALRTVLRYGLLKVLDTAAGETPR